MGLFAWMRRFVPGPSCPEVKPERRISVRFPCRLSAKCAPEGGGANERRSVVVTDISRGGFRMVADEALEPGAFVSVEIPGHTSTAILAYVVRQTPRADGAWDIGCAFAAEISDADLRRLEGESGEAEPADRRAWGRAACDKPICFQVVGAEPARWLPATVVDISPGGVGLRVNHRVELEEMLRLELRGGDWQSATVLLAGVVRTTELPGGGWLLGCSFNRELSDEELQALLA
jgi:hypothetical protein